MHSTATMAKANEDSPVEVVELQDAARTPKSESLLKSGNNKPREGNKVIDVDKLDEVRFRG